MKRFLGLAIIILVSRFGAQAQQQSNQSQQQQGQQQGQPEQPPKEEKRPTLGPEPAPAPGTNPGPSAPATDFVQDAAKLMRVRKVYVEPIDNHLSEKLLEGLSKSGRFQVVAEKKDADAVLRGTCFDARHLRSVHSEVFLSDRLTGKSIWQDVVHVPYNPPPLAKAVQATADQILRHLANSAAHAQPK